MAAFDKMATLARAREEFGRLSDDALDLYWAALQNDGRVLVDKESARVKELVGAKMAKTRFFRHQGWCLILSNKAWRWVVLADKSSRVPA
jgi:hypothetical protein